MGSSILVFSFMVWGLLLESNFCPTFLFVCRSVCVRDMGAVQGEKIRSKRDEELLLALFY